MSRWGTSRKMRVVGRAPGTSPGPVVVGARPALASQMTVRVWEPSPITDTFTRTIPGVQPGTWVWEYAPMPGGGDYGWQWVWHDAVSLDDGWGTTTGNTSKPWQNAGGSAGASVDGSAGVMELGTDTYVVEYLAYPETSPLDITLTFWADLGVDDFAGFFYSDYGDEWDGIPGMGDEGKFGLIFNGDGTVEAWDYATYSPDMGSVVPGAWPVDITAPTRLRVRHDPADGFVSVWVWSVGSAQPGSPTWLFHTDWFSNHGFTVQLDTYAASAAAVLHVDDLDIEGSAGW